MQSKGQILGFDFDDTVFIPVARALEMFNRERLQEIHITSDTTGPLHAVEDGPPGGGPRSARSAAQRIACAAGQGAIFPSHAAAAQRLRNGGYPILQSINFLD